MKSIYQTARESCGMTQEKAAELIGVSVESLRAYENNRRIPPTATVISMVDVYGVQFLAYQHLRHVNEIADKLLPDFDTKNIAEAVLTLVKEMSEAEKLIPTLISVASDGVIDDDERPVWEKIKKEFGDVVQSYYCMIISNGI